VSIQAGSYFLVLQCGPHWVRTASTAADAPMQPDQSHWQIKLPVYEPAATLTAVVFLENRSLLGGLKVEPRPVCKTQMLLNTLPVNRVSSRGLHSLCAWLMWYGCEWSMQACVCVCFRLYGRGAGCALCRL
jgi:hypothetical protein